MSNDHPSVRIGCENLAVLGVGEPYGERLPLCQLRPDSHIHGGLRLRFGERLVPHLGYFGPDDVCLADWLGELWQVARAFTASENGCHAYDEGEQGQPAFVFERQGDRAFFTIADAEFSGGQADPDWQQIEFSPDDFLVAHQRFRDEFFGTLHREAPAAAEAWIRQHDFQARSGQLLHADEHSNP